MGSTHHIWPLPNNSFHWLLSLFASFPDLLHLVSAAILHFIFAALILLHILRFTKILLCFSSSLHSPLDSFRRILFIFKRPDCWHPAQFALCFSLIIRYFPAWKCIQNLIVLFFSFLLMHIFARLARLRKSI